MKLRHFFIIILFFFFMSPSLGITEEKNSITELLLNQPMSKLDFGIYCIGNHLNDYFSRMNADGDFEIFPKHFIPYYSSENDQIIGV